MSKLLKKERQEYKKHRHKYKDITTYFRCMRISKAMEMNNAEIGFISIILFFFLSAIILNNKGA